LDDQDPPLLNYATPKPKTTPFAPPTWIAFSFLILQIISYPFSAIWSLDLTENGSPKQPPRDFFIYMVIVTPAMVSIALVLWQCRNQYRETGSLRGSAFAIFTLLLGLLFVAYELVAWIVDDVVHRNIPHGLF
jgi:heme/copper-type cytochrome/quinol oxidase subunit 3